MSNDDIARSVLGDIAYVVLATADADGLPWASPVWFATRDRQELFWVSFPGARHSQNIAVRPQVGLVVFDSTVAPSTGQAVYMSATADQVTDPAEIQRGLEVFNGVSVPRGTQEFGAESVTGESRLRLYRARVQDHSILDPDSPFDVRVGVDP